MPSITLLLKQLSADYPKFTFKKGTNFSWSPTEKIVYYNDGHSDNQLLLLHELAHAKLGHNDYGQDIELIKMERAAWDEVANLSKQYGVDFDQDKVQNALDTYRDWLHKRSTCPNCTANGVQVNQNHYKCLACNHKWRANEARLRALRRYNK